MPDVSSLPPSRHELPTWELMHRFNDGSGLPPDRKDAVRSVLAGLESRLGSSWVMRQFRDQGWLPPEFLAFAAYTAALPQLLTLYTRLEAWADEPGFRPVFSKVRRTCTTTDWRHAMLQIEVARAARAMGWAATFEPDIPDSGNKGDLLLNTGGESPVLVETTTLGRTSDDLLTDQFEHQLQDWLMRLERQHGVHTVTDLLDRPEPEAAQRWFGEIAQAAAAVAGSGSPVTLRCSSGTVTVRPGDAPVGEATFSGVPRVRDLGRRLRKLALDKAKQSAGPYPTWIRVDGLDGVFAFTPWAQAAPEDRIRALAEVLVEPLTKHQHVCGLIYSSGLAAGGYGAQPGTLDATVETTQGVFLCREQAQFLFRELIILPVRPEARELAAAWAAAYSREPSWLDEDLEMCGVLPLAVIRP